MDIHRFHLFHSLRTKCVNWWRDPTFFVPACNQVMEEHGAAVPVVLPAGQT